jgi:hypothetical protein
LQMDAFIRAPGRNSMRAILVLAAVISSCHTFCLSVLLLCILSFILGC